MFNITNLQENANQSHNEMVGMTINKIIRKIMVGEDVEKLENLCIVSRSENWCRPMENSMRVP